MSQPATFRRTPIAAAVLAALQTAVVYGADEPPPPESQLGKISVSGEGEDTNTYKAERVESSKFTQVLRDTPQTVTVIRKDVILQQGAASLTDTLRNTPGITFQLGENGNTQSGDTIFMRGFDTQNSIFLDGIRDLGAAVRDVFNVEQVEIFKGPAGADNGRGATSGYVNLVSKTPTQEPLFASSVAYGTEDHRRATADWDMPIEAVAGSAFRLNLMGQGGGVAGRDVIERKSWGIAPAIAFGLDSPTRFYAYSQHIHQDNTPDGAVPTIGVADYQLAALQTAGITAPPVDSENFYGLNSDFENIRANMVTARLEHDFSENLTLRNTSRYGKSEQERVLTAPLQAPIVADGTVVRTDPNTWTLNRTRHASFRKNEIITNQTNVTAKFNTGSIKHSLSTGVELIYEKQDTPTVAGLGTLAPTSLYNPDHIGVFTVAPAIARTGAFSEGNTKTGAVYAFDTWELTSRWQLTTGLRWEHFKTETQTVAITGTTTTDTRLDAEDSLLSWKTGLLFKPTENGSVYVAFANSLRPPGTENFTLNATPGNNNNVNANNPNLDPQKAKNLELGTKWDLLQGQLAFTAAVFQSKNENDLARTDPGDPDSIIQYGEKEVKGVELGLVGQITPAWLLSAGLTRQDTEVKEGTFGGTQTGASINFSPKFSATLWTTYKLPMGLTVGGGLRHIDTQARTVSNVPVTAGVFQLPAFTVVDLYAAYDVTQNIAVQLNAYNVADEEYVSAINNSGQRYIAGIPRSYLATVNFRF
jgi:catecholate siderophore receptor